MLSRNCISAPGPLGKLEAVEQLVDAPVAARARRPCGARAAWPSRCRTGRASSKPCAPQRSHDARASRRGRCTCTPTKMCASLGVGDAVVELGDVARAERARRTCRKLPRPLRDRHREQRLAVLADLGALGDEAQAVEVGVGAGGDRDQRLAARAVCARPRPWRRRPRARPAGSRTARVSSNTSLIAAQISSVSTSTISSTSSRHRRKVSSPTCFTATPSANRPT